MPIYEFHCPDNNKTYSFYARTLAQGTKTPRCPDNPKFRMERVLSPFSVKKRAVVSPSGEPGGADMDDPRMEAAMAEMEREFGGMDTENPDPRQLARMMRKMSAITGESMPQEMEEMLGRMERGEDPEKLEAEYAGALDALDAPSENAGGEGASEEKAERRKHLTEQLKKLRNRPVRDPKLYEMSEFTD